MEAQGSENVVVTGLQFDESMIELQCCFVTLLMWTEQTCPLCN